jgi:16S rRNA processing protein RimM
VALAVGVPPASEPEPAPPAADEPLIEAGRVGRPHGLDGSFHVTRPVPALLGIGAQVRLAGRAAVIVRRAGVNERPIVRVEGVEDRASAEALRGRPLLVACESVPALGPGEYWAHELEGCTVIGERGPLGVVQRMIELPSCEALQVSCPAGGQLLVPLVRDAIEKIDPAHREIRVNASFLGLGD